MNKPDVKKLILLNLPYVFAFYFADKIAAVFRLAPGTEFIDKLTNGFAVFGTAFANPLPSFHPVDLLIGLIAGALLKLAVYVKGKNRKKFRQGEEYGSARWGKPEDIKPYMDPEFSNNVILTQTEFLTMNSRPKQPKYARNKNILVIGGSGSGKTRFFVKPNLMQMHSSYVVTDPKGTVLVECGKMLEKGGYVIKSLNTINFRKSMHYNPFAYIRSEKDILKLVNTIILNTKGDGDKSGEDFWVKAEKLYYTALIGYIWYEAPDHEKNFTTLLEMINASEAREDDETFKNPVDVMFDELEARDPDHFAVKQYRKYKLAAGVDRSEFFITTKAWKDQLGYDRTLAAFDASCQALGMDYLDLYLIHWPRPDAACEEWKELDRGSWRAMEELYRAGRVRAIGVSNFLPHHLENLLEVCTVPPMVDQIEFHPGYVQWETVEFCRASQILVEAWSPLGRQRLADDPLLAELAGKYGVSQAQICLRFALDCGVVPLPKSADAGRMRQNLALDFALEAEDLERLRTMPQTGWSGLHPDK